VSTQIGALSWPNPGVRALEIAMAVALAFCALVLRGSRWPQFPSLPPREQTRADPPAVAWTSIQLHRPNVPEFVWALLGGVAVGLFVGGPAALPAGLIGTIGTFVWLARRRTQVDLREKARLSAQIPPLADLFAAGLAAGLQPAQAAVTVAQAFGSSSYVGGGRAGTDPPREPDRSKLTGIDLLACRFHDAATAVLAGADPQAAWGALAFDEAIAPLAAAVIRADRTGAPAAATVGRAARELRDAAADALAAEVRTVGVRATAPLTLCFLPAFVFLGVLPTALSLLSRLHA
jgi:hypothetical protein